MLKLLRKTLVKVPSDQGTIPHEQLAKYGGATIFIKPAADGTGVKAGGAMRAVLESVGVTDVLAKSKGSSNPHNLVKATINALLELRDAYTVAEQRGVTMTKFLTDNRPLIKMAKIKITQIKSKIGSTKTPKKNLRSTWY